MDFSVTQFRKPLDKWKYEWDEETKTFITDENNLMLDFTNCHGYSFITGHFCIFKTGNHCTFNTKDYCVFNTNSGCVFDVGENCSVIYNRNYELKTYKTPINKITKILSNGSLLELDEILIKNIGIKDDLVYLCSDYNKFVYEMQNPEQLKMVEAFRNQNYTELFMLSDGSKLSNNLLKVFKYSP